MTDAPERIWAWPAGNAASTSIFPYDEDTDSNGLVEYVRADLMDELSAENERLRQEVGECKLVIEQQDRHVEALSRTGEVKETDVMVCPQCEGDGSYADGLDDAACTTTCTRCESNGWIVNIAHHSRDTNSVEGHEEGNTEGKIDWKAAFAAQSRKLQHVLHIDGVKEALSAMAWAKPAEPEGQHPPAYIYDIAHLYDKKTNKYSGWRTRVSITKPCAGLGQRNARPSEPTVTEAGKALIRIVEGVEGAVKHGTWRDTSGMRLKDTPEWAAFYVATRSLPEDPQPVAWQRRCLYPSAPGSIPQWNQCCASEATNQFERKPDYEYRPLYHHPSDQPITEAMIGAALYAFLKTPKQPGDQRDAMRAALKAAMETKP